MRVLVCANRDLLSNLALNLLRPALSAYAFDIVLSDGIGKSAPMAQAIARWQRHEGEIFEQLFTERAHNSVDGRYVSFAGLAGASLSGRPLAFADINRDGLSTVRSLAPDVIVSIRFGQIFKPPLLAVPGLRIINLHSGLLPDYRGILATFWAMLEGAACIGCTLHEVTDGTIDTGAIIARHVTPIASASLLRNLIALYDGGTAIVARALAALARREALVSEPQDARRARYFSYPKDPDVEAFHARGYRLYDEEDYAAICSRYGAVR